MEFMRKVLWVLVVLLMTSLFQIFIIIKRRRARDHSVFPRGPPGAWPILGHVPFLREGCPHHALAELSRKPGYGAIIGLRLGCRPAVVISSAELAREVLVTQDKTFAHRPHFELADSLLYGFDVGIVFSRSTPRWANLRKICALELFSPKRLQALQQVRQEEVQGLLHRLLEASCQGTQAVNLGECLNLLSFNTISRLVHSKSVLEVGGDSYTALLKELEQEGAPTVGDMIPWLKFLDLMRKSNMKHIHHRIDKIIDTILSQRRDAMKSTQAHDLPQDFLQVLLSKEAINLDKAVPHQFSQEEFITTQEIKGIMFDLLSAGSHTTALTLEWAMAELLRNPSCLRKLRDEVDAVMGKENRELVRDEDVAKLPYLENTVKEVFRLHPAVPLLVPRMSNKAAKVDKYRLPSNTLVFVNAWALGRDPQVWENTEAFEPDRFKGKEMDVRGQHYELLAFGGGRRVCPGIRVALSVVHVTLANLVKAFDWELPHGQIPSDLDMSEQRGFTTCRATPVLAIPKPRL